MPDFYQGLVDARGRPIEKQLLTQEISAAQVGGVRTPLTGYPGDGLTPVRLAKILKDADAGDPTRQLELAEAIEERDLHLVGVLGTRRRSVSQLEITVEPGDDSAAADADAELVREWLKRDELAGELFDMLDAIHKGYSFTEIIWDQSEGQWQPVRLEWVDPRWFDFERHNLTAPQRIELDGSREPLPGGKYIYALMKAKSGIPLRGGLARNTAWAWVFKAYSNRDVQIFLQNYGHPIRIAKWGQGATPEDKASLLRAITAIGSDMAAMIPASMAIEIIESKSASANAEMFLKRMDWLDQQVSKAVLGQTATTDAINGGHAVGQEHRQVQEDIERADARQLATFINRDLIRIWMMLNGPRNVFPRIRIGRAEVKDIAKITTAARTLKLKVKASEAYELVGFSKPEAGDEVIDLGGSDETAALDRRPAPEDKPADRQRRQTSEELQTEDPGLTDAEHAERQQLKLAADATTLSGPASDALLQVLAAIVADPSIRDLEELRTQLLAAEPELSPKALARILRQAIAVAELTGRADLVDA